MTDADLAAIPRKRERRCTHYMSPMKRFYVYTLQGRKTDCWPWAGAYLTGGYGMLRMKDKTEGAHRVSYELHNGPIPKGLWVLHRCDNRACVNPRHLFLGTIQDNIADAQKKGRLVHGAASRGAKLDDAKVAMIWEKSRAGLPMTQIASLFSVSHGTVSMILGRKTWKHVRPAPPEPPETGEPA